MFYPELSDELLELMLSTYMFFIFSTFLWSSIFIVSNIDIVAVILEHFDQVVGDCFMDCVNCLIGFANNKTSHRISLKAIALLRICEDRLAEVCPSLFNVSGDFLTLEMLYA